MPYLYPLKLERESSFGGLAETNLKINTKGQKLLRKKSNLKFGEKSQIKAQERENVGGNTKYK